MLCLRSSRGVTAALKSSTIAWAVKAPAAPATRTFTSLTPLRPSIFPSNLSAFRTPSVTAPVTSSSTAESALDLLPKISSNPAFAGIQVRCGPRNTFSPSHFVRKRRHGFLSRINTRKGRALLQRRKNKRRSTLSH